MGSRGSPGCGLGEVASFGKENVSALLGPGGAGHTTVLRILAEEEESDAGEMLSRTSRALVVLCRALAG